MIEALSETYRAFARTSPGVSPGEVTVLMIHRPHEDKNYADQSVFFFFLPRAKHPAAVGKVGFDPEGAQYLEREHRGLQTLSDRRDLLPPESVPRPLLFREVAGRCILLQSVLQGEKVSTWIKPRGRYTARHAAFLEWAADWTAALGKATLGEAGGLVPVWTEEFSVKLDRTGSSRVLLESAAREVWEGFGQRFPSVLAHGDFCGENILDNRGRFGVIDWELCDERSLPAYDLLDLLLWMVFRSEGRGDVEPFGALDRLLKGPDPLAHGMRRALGRYARGMGFRTDLLPSLLTLTWAGYCLKKFRYLERDETGNFARARAGVRKILDTPAEILSGERNAS